MTKTCRQRHHPSSEPRIDETKEHILAAGRELLLAAQGALRFCRTYAETQAAPAARSQLSAFFTKAITVADDLSESLSRASSFTRAASTAAAPLLGVLAREIRHEQRAQKAKARSTTATPSAPKKKRSKRTRSR